MRIAALPTRQYPLISRLFFWLQKRNQHSVMMPTLLWGRSPWLLVSFTLFFKALSRKKSPITPTLRALVCTYVSQLNHCAFCVDLNASFLSQIGITQEKLLALINFRTSTLFSPMETLVLTYSEQITLTGQKVDDATFNELKQHFNDDAIIELTAIISFQNLSSKFNAALDVPSQGFCQQALQT